MSTLANELRAYAKKIEQLEDRILQLEDLLGMGQEDVELIRTAIPSLQLKEAKILGLLRSRRSACSFEDVMDAVYGETIPESALAAIRVGISTLRAKIADHGLSIVTMTGTGYLMPEPSRKLLTTMMQAVMAAPAIMPVAPVIPIRQAALS